MCKFTVFIPAYNRVHTLERLLISIERQQFKNLECIIVDDGSTDGTNKFIEKVKKEFTYPIRYIYQHNSGKHVARNTAIELARGDFFLTIDSDDTLYPNTLQKMLEIWEKEVPIKSRSKYVGVEGLCVRMGDKKQLGDRFPENVYHSNHLDTRFKMDIKGDKIRFIRTDVFRENLFPVIEGEKFITESTVWNKIGLHYKTVYVNEVFAEVEYQSDGLSNNSLINRVKNPKGGRLYYKNFLSYISSEFKPKSKYVIRNLINYFRFSFHAKVSLNKQIKENPLKWIYNCLLPVGYTFYLIDKLKIYKS